MRMAQQSNQTIMFLAGHISVTSSPAGLVTVDINYFGLATQDLVDTVLGETSVEQLRAALVR